MSYNVPTHRVQIPIGVMEQLRADVLATYTDHYTWTVSGWLYLTKEAVHALNADGWIIKQRTWFLVTPTYRWYAMDEIPEPELADA